MTLIGCDLHARMQQVAVLDTGTGEIQEHQFPHHGDAVERFLCGSAAARNRSG